MWTQEAKYLRFSLCLLLIAFVAAAEDVIETQPPKAGAGATRKSLSPPTSAGVKSMAPVRPLKPEKQAREEMHHFLYAFDPRSDGLPKRIEPALVERFLQEELQKGRPPTNVAMQLAELADFYDARGVIPAVMRYLDHQEGNENHFLTSVTLTRLVGLLGTRAQRQTGQLYYHYLLTLPYVEQRMADVLSCLEVYFPDETSALTTKRIDQLLAALQVREAKDWAAGPILRNLEDIKNTMLSRMEAALALRLGILGTADTSRRLDQLVDVYLGLDMRYYEYMQRWSVRALQKEARSGGTDSTIAAFRRALGRLNMDHAPEDAVKARRARLVHGIEYLGGTLSAGEATQAQPASRKMELLSTEP